MNFNWNEDKNKKLQQERSISFDDIELAIASGNLLEDIQHPNQTDYPHQRVLIVGINAYAYVVPYVFEEDGTRFLKTIYRSRVATKHYLANL